MKNNKGFTLIELLATVVLLAVVTTIAVPSVMNISRKIKQNMLETKLDLMKENAKLYGEDHLTEIASASETLKLNGVDLTYPCKNITIGELVEEGYVSLDEEDAAGGKVINPVNNEDMSNINIIIYLKNKRVVTKYNEEQEEDDAGNIAENTYSCD